MVFHMSPEVGRIFYKEKQSGLLVYQTLFMPNVNYIGLFLINIIMDVVIKFRIIGCLDGVAI